MEDKCRGWGMATPDSPFHTYNWEVQAYHYVFNEDRLNTLRIKAIIESKVEAAGFGDYSVYGYPQLECLQLPNDFTQLDMWRLHLRAMEHLIYCNKCSNQELCHHFHKEFKYPTYVDECDPDETWNAIPF